jgi:hypothetical protein
MMTSTRNIPGDILFATDYKLAKISSHTLTNVRGRGISYFFVKKSQMNPANGIMYPPVYALLYCTQGFNHSKTRPFKNSGASGRDNCRVNDPAQNIPFENSKIQVSGRSGISALPVPQVSICLKKPANGFWASANGLRVSARHLRASTRGAREPAHDRRASTRAMREPARDWRASTLAVREPARDWRMSANKTEISIFSIIQTKTFK